MPLPMPFPFATERNERLEVSSGALVSIQLANQPTSRRTTFPPPPQMMAKHRDPARLRAPERPDRPWVAQVKAEADAVLHHQNLTLGPTPHAIEARAAPKAHSPTHAMATQAASALDPIPAMPVPNEESAEVLSSPTRGCTVLQDPGQCLGEGEAMSEMCCHFGWFWWWW